MAEIKATRTLSTNTPSVAFTYPANNKPRVRKETKEGWQRKEREERATRNNDLQELGKRMARGGATRRRRKGGERKEGRDHGGWIENEDEGLLLFCLLYIVFVLFVLFSVVVVV